MEKRFTTVGVVVAFVLGAVIGGLAWDRWSDGRASGSGDRAGRRSVHPVPSSDAVSTVTPSSPLPVGSSDDLLDVANAVASLPAVSPCHMVEMYAYRPITVRAFCSTSVGDELRIAYQNDPTSHEEDILAFCDQLQGEGQGFYVSDSRWSLVQIGTDGTPDAQLTNDLADILGSAPVQCGG